jgi:hypothetical protein
MKHVALAVIILIHAGPGLGLSADSNVRLFREFNLGMSYNEVKKAPGVTDRDPGDPKNPPDANLLYRTNVNFAGIDWVQIFEFENRWLIKIVLVTELTDPTLYQKTVLTIVNSGFDLVGMGNSEGNDYDFLDDALKNGLSEAEKNVIAYEKEALNNGFIVLTYIDSDALEQVLPSYRPDLPITEILQRLPNNTREVQVTASAGDEESNGEPYIVVEFVTPKAYLANLRDEF